MRFVGEYLHESEQSAKTLTMLFLNLYQRYALIIYPSRCIYHTHAVDACSSWGQKGHATTERTVYVGYTCPTHSTQQTQSFCPPSTLSDSGYASGSHP